MTQIELFQYDQINETDRVYIQDRTIEIKALVKRSAQDIIDIGLKLIEVKERLPHGQWGKWLDSEFGWTQMTALKFVRVASKFKQYLNLDDFAPSALYLLAAPSTPDEAIDEAIDRARDGEAITHKAAKGIVTSHKEKFATTKDIKDQKDSLMFPDPKQIPTPLEMANDFAEKEEGYTEEEWNERPHSYMGNCFKQCYEPGLMVKGEVWEYGVRGVYVCSGCGYAYPPMMEPDKIDLEEYNRVNQLDEEDDSPSRPMKPKSNQSGDLHSPKGYDACQTPAYGVAPLLPFLNRDWTIWEPAAGENHLVEALHNGGFDTDQVITSDILTGENFFEFEPPSWSCLVTNPPYSIKYQWLERCYELGKPFALLVPVEILGAKTAQELLKKYGFEIMLLNRRVDFKMPNKGWENSSAQFPVLWLCWKVLPEKVMFGEIEKNG